MQDPFQCDQRRARTKAEVGVGGRGREGVAGRTAERPGRRYTASEADIRRAVEAARTGDRAAVGMLYTTYGAGLERFVRGLVDSDQTAEDVTQMVFTKLLTGIDGYVPGPAPFAAWLRSVARNAARDEMRRSRRTVPSAPSELLTPCAAPDVTEPARDLWEALGRLPEPQRRSVLLLDLVGLSASEAAQYVDRSEAAVHALAARGRRAVRRRLAGGATQSAPSVVLGRRVRVARPATPAAIHEIADRPHPRVARAG